MNLIKIKLVDEFAKTSEEISAEFDPDEINILEDYLLNTAKLLKVKMIADGMSGHVSFNFDKNNGLSFETHLPKEENVLAFLHQMRKFILQNEYSSYNKVTGLISRRFNNTAIREIIKKQRKVYDGTEFQESVVIKSNNTIINSEKTLFDWLNAFEYHSEQPKKKQLEKLHELLPLEVSRVAFLTLLSEKVRAIIHIAKFVALLIGKAELFETYA
jgi:hypothetical protein